MHALKSMQFNLDLIPSPETPGQILGFASWNPLILLPFKFANDKAA
jgi:hypothetical protein